MSSRVSLPDHEEWLAAEYALGVLPDEQRKQTETRYDRDADFRAAVDGWYNQLEPMLSEIGEEVPPPAVWKTIERQIGVSAAAAYADAADARLWKWLTGLASAAAVACAVLLVSVTQGDIFGTGISEMRSQIARSDDEIKTLSGELETARSELAATNGELDAARQEIATVTTNRESSIQQVAALEQQLADTRESLASVQLENQQTLARLEQVEQSIDAAIPLVASLTSEGELPAFVAQYDPLKRSLLIRTSAPDEDEKVPEIWFIPEKGSRKGEVLSLGVMNEDAPDRLPVSDEFAPWMDEGGTLAITMEPAGGSPTGVATGPIIAVGKLQALQ